MFKVSTKDARDTLYLLEMEVEGERMLKIGITSKKFEERLQSIAMSIYNKHRYVPWIRPKRFRKVDSALVKEQKLLEYFKEYKFETEKQWGGYTETIQLDMDIVVEAYEKVVKGEELVEDGEVCWCGKIKKFEVEGEMCCGYKHKESTEGV